MNCEKGMLVLRWVFFKGSLADVSGATTLEILLNQQQDE